MRLLILTLLFINPHISHGQNYHLKKVETNVASSFRGLSIVDDKIAWISGSNGYVGQTTNGGKNWSFSQVKGFEGADFRSLYAFDDQKAIIGNVGSPAKILFTKDAGKNWITVYTNPHPDAFFDGVDFWNAENGIMYGDPIDGKMLMLITNDGGQSWVDCKEPPLLEKGEASFAASGTGIRCTSENEVIISTGGVVSRLWISKNNGLSWTSISTPIVQGKTTAGIFSFTQHDNVLTIVGGDFQNELMTIQHNFYSIDQGKNWLKPTMPIRGYRECVESISATILVAIGPSGADISYDNGVNWKGLSDEKGLHVVRKARNGSFVIAAGSNGQVFLIE
ncbi:MAG: YCF48-related protein [Bacteroidota bacterium]